MRGGLEKKEVKGSQVRMVSLRCLIFFSGDKAGQPYHGMAGAGGVFWGNQGG